MIICIYIYTFIWTQRSIYYFTLTLARPSRTREFHRTRNHSDFYHENCKVVRRNWGLYPLVNVYNKRTGKIHHAM